jgi:sugar/nucleoside kinase (ribokinase family)
LKTFDVCVVGHLTKDIIVREGQPVKYQPGGVAYYAAMAYQSMGLTTAVVTRLAESDELSLLQELSAAGATMVCHSGTTTTVFENIYSASSLDIREQKVPSVAAPFRVSDLADLRAGLFHLGPLTNRDIDAALLKTVRKRADQVALDAQGLIRGVQDSQVVIEDWDEKASGLAYVHYLKVDEREATILTGESEPDRAARRLANLGPREVIVTLGSRGSLLLVDGNTHAIPAFSPRGLADATGCGDTYFAGYLSERMKGSTAERAGRFAAALATVKLEHYGPFRGSLEDVEALL